jgi:16S rRNA C967 or C1407 C5-methylase (RsmB/RsmF family)
VLSTLRAGEEDEGTKYTQLLPHRDGCDGFFAAVFEKTE